MRRRAPGERVAAFRRRRVVPRLHELRDRLAAWVGGLEDIEDAEPELPVEDRDADKWEPLIAIADAAGGHWPQTARRACVALCGDVEPDEATLGERLLHDLAGVWGDAEQLPTAEILARLHGVEEAPWGDYYGRPLSARDLARLLRPYGIRSRNIRVHGAVPKGYVRGDLADAWARYTPATSATPLREDERAAQARSGDVAQEAQDTATAVDQGQRGQGSAVADVAAARSGDADADAQARLADVFGPLSESEANR